MYWLIVLMSTMIIGLIIFGFILEFKPNLLSNRSLSWHQPVMGVQLLIFILAQLALLFSGLSDALAQGTEIVRAVPPDFPTGLGLSILGIGLPTGLSAIAAAIAVGPIGAASIAAISEKPENLGRTLIYLGLAEGIAIYGVVVSILLLNDVFH